MDFLLDNYVWFICGGVIAIMTIIGYFAEKTDFGRKNRKLEESNIDEVSEGSEISEVVPEQEISSETKKNLKKDKKREKEEKKNQKKDKKKNSNKQDVVEEVVSNINPVYEDITSPVLENEIKDEGISEDLYAPLGDVVESNSSPVEDLSVAMNEFQTENVYEEIKLPETEEPLVISDVNEDLYAPLGDTPVVNETADTNTNESDNLSQEDVWKF